MFDVRRSTLMPVRLGPKAPRLRQLLLCAHRNLLQIALSKCGLQISDDFGVFCWCSFALFFRTSQLFNHSPAQLLSVVSVSVFQLSALRSAPVSLLHAPNCSLVAQTCDRLFAFGEEPRRRLTCRAIAGSLAAAAETCRVA